MSSPGEGAAVATADSAAPDNVKMAAAAVGLTKVYGEGNTRVVALDNVDVGFEAGRLTAIMGPSGSGKSTLMHCMAGLDEVTGGEVRIGDTLISDLSDKELTLLRRSRLGFIFQSFNLVPTLTASENIELPLELGGRKPDKDWKTRSSRPSRSAIGSGTDPPNSPAVSNSGSPSPGRSCPARHHLRRRADGQPRQPQRRGGARFLRRAVDEWEQTVVMVTHDAKAASYADVVIFLRDGKLVDRLERPTADLVLDRIRSLEI